MARESLDNEDLTETKSVLDEKASIYKKREDKTEKEKWKDLDGKGKWKYFSQYYLLKVVIAVLVLAVIVYTVWSILKPKTPVAFYMAYVYGQIDKEKAEDVIAEFAEKSGIDRENEQVVISDEFYTDQYNGLSATEKLISFSYTNQLDLVVADEDVFEKLAASGNMMNIESFLGDELYKEIEDKVFKCGYSDIYLDGEEDSNEYPFGFYVKDNEIYKAIGCTELENPVVGVIASSVHSENAINFIKYMLGEF